MGVNPHLRTVGHSVRVLGGNATVASPHKAGVQAETGNISPGLCGVALLLFFSRRRRKKGLRSSLHAAAVPSVRKVGRLALVRVPWAAAVRACSARSTSSSSRSAAGVRSLGRQSERPAGMLRDLLARDAGMDRGDPSSLVAGSGSRTQRSVMIRVGPLVVTPRRARSSPPSPWPSEVTNRASRRSCALVCS